MGIDGLWNDADGRRAKQPFNQRPFEVCALDVGNGSAILVRAGPSAILFDAGSSSVVDVGRRTIVPALAAMGVRRLDAVVLSHPNADHISGLPAILDLIEVAQVVVSPQFLLAAARDEPVARATVASIRRRGVPIIVVARGDTATFGALSFDVLHPRAEEVCRTVNDSSIVAIIHAEGEQGRVLVCGDVESEAISRVLAREPDLQAEVMELPHHGSWGAEPRAFLESVNPSIVVQSTGRARLAFDRWGPLMDGRERIITARDGAVVVRVPQAVQKKRKPAT
jgi:competence protein ComEC